MKQHVHTFESFTNEAHFYSPGSDMERLAGLGSGRTFRYSSPQNLMTWAKKFLTPDKLSALSADKVTLRTNSKTSFYIETKGSFDFEKIKPLLQDFAERFMGMEGLSGLKFSLEKPNQIFVVIDSNRGVEFEG